MYAPERVVTNDDLAQMMDTSDEWIRTRTGIERRHFAAETEATGTMAIEAARAALDVADSDPHEIGLILVATMTPDYGTPSTACLVQNALNAIHAGALDVNAGCSGSVYALTLAHQAIASGEHTAVLVVGADTMTRIVNMEDRATAVLFGDGAGAVLLRASEEPAGVLASLVGADGSGADMLMVPAGGSARPASPDTVMAGQHYITMDGNQVFRFATRMIPRIIERVVEKAGLQMDAVDWFIPHQANARILEAAAKRINVDMSRFCLNLQEYGNTSAASVPMALCEAVQNGRILPGHHLVMVGFGAGLTWAAAVVRWGPSVREVPAAFYRRLWRWFLYRWAAGRTGWRHATRWVYDRVGRPVAKRLRKGPKPD